MSFKDSRDSRRFLRAASRCLEAALFLLDGNFTTDAVYLAGYAVECMLKALILAREPTRRNARTMDSFRGVSAHSFEWLKARLSERQFRVPVSVAEALASVDGCTTSLRYEPRQLEREVAETFLQAATKISVWVKENL